MSPGHGADFTRSRQSMRNSPEPGENDSEGHYHGSTSSINFIARAKKRLRSLETIGTMQKESEYSTKPSIFTFGDAGLPESSGGNFQFPSEENARSLIDRYFDFAMPTYRFLHRQTIEQWVKNMYRRKAAGDQQAGDTYNTEEAVVMLVFAVAMWYRVDSKGNFDNSINTFESRYVIA